MVKILFLHGFAQNPQEIQNKTSTIRQGLDFANFIYPAAAIELVSYDGDIADRSRPSRDGLSRYSWNYLNEDLACNLFNSEASLARLIPILEEQGPFDGVMGFSQGAAVASAISSILEKGTHKINHPAFKFCVLFCGARPSAPQFDAIYHDIKTPSLHVIGKQDVMVPLERSLQVAEAFNTSTIMYHPGNHFIPQGAHHTKAIIDFVNVNLQRDTTFNASALSLTGSSLVIQKDTACRSTTPPQADRRERKLRMIRRPSGFRVQMMAC